jgi:hypothetical protein
MRSSAVSTLLAIGGSAIISRESLGQSASDAQACIAGLSHFLFAPVLIRGAVQRAGDGCETTARMR